MVHPANTEFVSVELVACVFDNVVLETVTFVKYTSVRVIGSVVVELTIVLVPLIPSSAAAAEDG